jgi:hypothetical protein
MLCRFVNGTGASVWAAPFTAAPSGTDSSLATWVVEIQKMFPSYQYGVNLFIMAFGECICYITE